MAISCFFPHLVLLKVQAMGKGEGSKRCAVRRTLLHNGRGGPDMVDWRRTARIVAKRLRSWNATTAAAVKL